MKTIEYFLYANNDEYSDTVFKSRALAAAVSLYGAVVFIYRGSRGGGVIMMIEELGAACCIPKEKKRDFH